jgi:DNA-binding IclR family transcriptional regulator
LRSYPGRRRAEELRLRVRPRAALRRLVNHNRTLGRTGVATAIRNASGTPIAAVTLLGPDSDVVPRINALGELLLKRVGEWRLRSSSSREPI